VACGVEGPAPPASSGNVHGHAALPDAQSQGGEAGTSSGGGRTMTRQIRRAPQSTVGILGFILV
jgi:hypothetical protein